MNSDERNEILDALCDAIAQACEQRSGELDSYALTAYANALRLLSRYGRVVITADVGRRVIARFVDANGPR